VTHDRQKVLVFDFGTTSLKVALVEDEQILAEATTTYPVSMPREGWAEQDPEELWQHAGTASRRLFLESGEDSAAVTGVVFIAPWKAIIPVAESGQVLRSASIWLDGRAQTEADELNRGLGEFIGTGQEIWPRLMWLRNNERHVWDAARWIMGLVTFFKWRATGRVVGEPSDSFTTSPFPNEQERIEAILECAGLSGELEKFPASRPSSEVVGPLLPTSAAHLGLSGTPNVFGGFGDLPAITQGAGPARAGSSHIYIGTSSWFATITDDVDTLRPPLKFTLNESHQVALYPLQTAGMAFDWIVEELYGHEQVHLDEELLERVNREVSEVPAGSGRLLATHWLNGELPPLDPTVRGAYINLTTQHDRRHMVRAMMESLCYTHRSSIDAYEEASGNTVDEVVCTGGGAASDVWMQMMADVLDRPVMVPENPRYTGVIGGYRISTKGAAGSSSSAQRRMTRFHPQAENVPIYREMHGYYESLYPALKELFARMNS